MKASPDHPPTAKSVELLFLEKVADRMAEDADTLKVLADQYTKEGFYEEGLRLDLRLAQLLPEDGMVHYNLACSLSLLGDVEGALTALREAVAHGYQDFEFMFADKDLEAVRRTAEFKKWLAMA